MAYERKVNNAGLFPNTVHPDKSDFTGQIDVACAHCGKQTGFWMNGWRKVTKTGGKYLSLSLRPKHGHPGVAPSPTDDSDIPW